MKGRSKINRGWIFLALCQALVLVACDDDPTNPGSVPLDGDFSVTPDTIGVQEAIRVVFNRAIAPATALDPSNFVVTDLCDTLRVPGSLRLDGDTLTFSPSEALPFLTLLSIRVQNILDTEGNALRQPITFQRVTQAPLVSDVSWASLNSPTNDIVSGISFADQDVGYALTVGGSVYRTTNGGSLFGARFKDPDISQTFNIQTFGGDTVVFLGAVLVGGTPQWAVHKSVDSALSFTTSNTVNRQLYGSQFRLINGQVVGVVGGQGSTPGLYRYKVASNTLTIASGTPSSATVLFTDVALSSDTTKAIATFFDFVTNNGIAYSSLDGGATYSPVTLPASVRRLRGTGFIDDASALLLGDSSTVLRVELATGQVTPLGFTNGIPQTETVGSVTNVFRFSRARFAAGGQVGWISGSVTRRQPGVPDVVQGVILQTDDGGQTWRRQAIQGAPENGLGFPAVAALQAFDSELAIVSGSNGFIAARRGNSAPAAQACSFSQ